MIVQLDPKNIESVLVERLRQQLHELHIDTCLVNDKVNTDTGFIKVEITNSQPGNGCLQNGNTDLTALLESVIRQIPFDFDKLPKLVEGESKIIRLLNDKIVVERFKPTVYSYTKNRYGNAEGTEELRIQFTAEVFRKMNQYAQNSGKNIKNAFLATIETPAGTLIVQKRVQACNLEVRVKRYHIGSPLHRYLYTALYPTTQGDGPLKAWSRFNTPVVCFDWRHPLHDEYGNRLADEPISDDYAAVWMEKVPAAKILAKETFLWLENLFREAGLLLIDICFFIDQSGEFIYGEISPDCMRVREGLTDPNHSESFDKDIWRMGKKAEELSDRYKRLYQLVFHSKIKNYGLLHS